MHPRDMDNVGMAFQGRGIVGSEHVAIQPEGRIHMEQEQTQKEDNHMASSLEAYHRVAEENNLVAYPKAYHDAIQLAHKEGFLKNMQTSNLNSDTNAHRSQLSSYAQTSRYKSDCFRGFASHQCLKSLIQ